MTPRMTIDFQLEAEVNGETFQMNGTGYGVPADGTCVLELQATPRFPRGFDPVSCPMICSHPTSSIFSRAVIEGVDLMSVVGCEFSIEPARVGVIHDSRGKELLRLNVSSVVRAEGKRLISKHRMVGRSALPRLARNVTPIEDFIFPSGPGEATASVRYKLLTDDGEMLDGMTIVPYRWQGAPLPWVLVRRVERLDVEWNGIDQVRAMYKTEISPLLANARDDRAFTVQAESIAAEVMILH